MLREHGIAWEGRQPHHMDHVANEQFDLVITVCDEARDACPIFPGATARVHWGIADPARELDPVRAREAFEATFDVLSARIDSFLTLPFEGMERAQLAHAAQQIHDVT